METENQINNKNKVLLQQAHSNRIDTLLMKKHSLTDDCFPDHLIFQRVKKINFSKNKLTAIDLLSSQFTNSEEINKTYNNVPIIIKSILQLPKLKLLNQYSTKIEELPEQISQNNIRQLHLQQNEIKTIGEKFQNINKLEQLNLFHN